MKRAVAWYWLVLGIALQAIAPFVSSEDFEGDDGSLPPLAWEHDDETQRLLSEEQEALDAAPSPTVEPPTEPNEPLPAALEPPEPVPPAPSPTPDPNIPPGMEELELLAFRLEYAHEDALAPLMEWAYDWVVKDRAHEDGVLRTRDLPDFLHRTLNPAEEDIEDEERALLKTASDALREEQGLYPDDMPVYIGFLSRGSPVRYVRQLAHDMHHQNRARRRRLEAVEDRDL